MEIWGDLAPQKLPEWNSQTQVLLGVLGRPGTLSGPAWPCWVCGFVTALFPQSLFAYPGTWVGRMVDENPEEPS